MKMKMWRRYIHLNSSHTLLAMVCLTLALFTAACSTSQSTSNLPNSDAGASPIVLNFKIVSLHMIGTSSGWAFTNQGFVVHTDDGGNTWKNVSQTADMPTFNGGGMQAGFFPSGTNAWIAVGDHAGSTGAPSFVAKLYVYHTTDAGAHWQKTQISSYDGQCEGDPQISFGDSTHGWLLCSMSPGAGTAPKELFRTTDGGQTWKKLNPAGGIGPGYANGMTFVDDKQGWLTGYDATSDSAHIVKTVDGGNTWVADGHAPGSGPDTFVTSYPGVAFNSLQIVIPTGTSDGKSANMYVTSNGNKWYKLATVSGDASTASYSDPDHVWIADNQNHVLYTSTDGGQHWTKCYSSLSAKVVELNFTSASTGWALQGTSPDTYSMYKTTDGGKSWSLVNYTVA